MVILLGIIVFIVVDSLTGRHVLRLLEAFLVWVWTTTPAALTKRSAAELTFATPHLDITSSVTLALWV